MTLLLALHITANLAWIGAIVSVGLLLRAGAAQPEPDRGRLAGELARSLYLRVATPAFLVSFLAGLGRVFDAPGYYGHAHWFHAKITLALAVIALHHIIGAKSKRAASGSVQAGARGAILAAAVLACAFAVVLLVTFRTELVP